MLAGVRHHRPVIFTRSELRSIGLTVVVMAAAAVTYSAKVGGSIAPFVISGVALTLLASLVGRSAEALGDRRRNGGKSEFLVLDGLRLR
jgi:hypothetical protein